MLSSIDFQYESLIYLYLLIIKIFIKFFIYNKLFRYIFFKLTLKKKYF